MTKLAGAFPSDDEPSDDEHSTTGRGLPTSQLLSPETVEAMTKALAPIAERQRELTQQLAQQLAKATKFPNFDKVTRDHDPFQKATIDPDPFLRTGAGGGSAIAPPPSIPSTNPTRELLGELLQAVQQSVETQSLQAEATDAQQVKDARRFWIGLVVSVVVSIILGVAAIITAIKIG